MSKQLEERKAEALANLGQPVNRDRLTDEQYAAEVARVTGMWDEAAKAERRGRVLTALVVAAVVVGFVVYSAVHHSGPTENDIDACGTLNGDLVSVANNVPPDWSTAVTWGQEANNPKIVAAANQLAQSTNTSSDSSAIAAYESACSSLGLGDVRSPSPGG